MDLSYCFRRTGAVVAYGAILYKDEGMRFLMVVLASCLLMLAGCAQKATEKRYPMRGEIRALDATTRTATIAAGKIGDWMEAMTMEYPVKPDAEFAKLHVGDRIEATVVVSDPAYYVTEIRIAPK
jgi:Cu/Ag efflux protein CusF